jgi:DNA invertase Pin-like site-specific DNA recombinase
MASVAELEAGLISQRTKAALKAAKDRGTVLGRPNSNIHEYAREANAASVSKRREAARQRAEDLIPVIEAIKAEGRTSLRQIAAELNRRSIPGPRGGEWSSTQVMRVLNASA